MKHGKLWRAFVHVADTPTAHQAVGDIGVPLGHATEQRVDSADPPPQSPPTLRDGVADENTGGGSDVPHRTLMAEPTDPPGYRRTRTAVLTGGAVQRLSGRMESPAWLSAARPARCAKQLAPAAPRGARSGR